MADTTPPASPHDAEGRRPGVARRLVTAATLATPPVAWLAASLGFGLAAGDEPLLALPWLVLLSVAEEIVFRGGLQPWLAARIGRRDALAAGLTASNLATSAVFAALHLLRHPPLLALAVLPVSLVLGAVRETSGRVWPCALLHAGFNAALVIASMLRAATAA